MTPEVDALYTPAIEIQQATELLIARHGKGGTGL